MKIHTALLTIVAACSTFVARSFATNIIFATHEDMIDTGAVQNLFATHPANPAQLELRINFTLFDVATYAVRIDSIEDPPTLTYVGSQDPNDMALNPFKTGGSCGAGTILDGVGSVDDMGQPTDRCTEQFNVTLFDPRFRQDPDKDYGNWFLKSIVKAHKNGDTSVTDANYFAAHIYVLDKGADVPEPASMLLIGGGMIGLGLLRRWTTLGRY